MSLKATLKRSGALMGSPYARGAGAAGRAEICFTPTRNGVRHGARRVRARAEFDCPTNTWQAELKRCLLASS